MALVNAYTSVTALKTRLGDIPDDVDDAALEQVINAASRMIDGMTGRTFYPATDTRYYAPLSYTTLPVPDLLSITTIKTDEDADGVYETTIAADAYDLTSAGEGFAVLRIRPASYSEVYFPLTLRSVEITGTWGAAETTPPDIEEACLLIAQRLFVRKNAPYGLVGTASEFGTRQMSIPETDPDVKRLLAPYMASGVVV